jgi:outer membrane protein assembly factor BamB
VPPAEVAAPEEPPAEVGPLAVDKGWATFHAGPERAGAVGAPSIGKPSIAWRAKVGIQSWLNGPLALGSIAVVPSSGKTHNAPDADDGLHALDMQTGRRVWRARTGNDANGALATADRVIVTSDDEHVHAFDLRTGKPLWKQKGAGKMYTHPLRVGDRVVVGDAGGNLRAYALSDGKPLWSHTLTGAIRGGAASDGKLVYALSQGGEAIAVSPDGKQAWRQSVDRPAFGGQGKNEPIDAYASPIVTADSLIVPFSRDTYYQGQPGLLALDKRNGRVKWRAKGPGEWGNVRTTPVLVSGLLVWGEPYSGAVAALSVNTGRLVYRHTIGPCFFPQWASPAAASDVVYLPRFDGTLYSLDAKNGRVRWELYLGDGKIAGQPRAAAPSGSGCTWDVPSGHPLFSPVAVAEDGTLLAGSGEGMLYAIREPVK